MAASHQLSFYSYSDLRDVAPEEYCNYSHGYCSEEMNQDEMGKNTAIALIRMVTSILSILGSSSIILSVLIKRQVRSSKVHPIFVLSIADCLLALLWVIGGVLWLTAVQSHLVLCFIVTLMTVILECVAINLTFVYALYAYAHITHINFSSLLYSNSSHGWSRLKVGLVYAVAWLLPTVLVMIPFGIVAGHTQVLHNANHCSCGCVPKFANVLPFPSKPHNKMNEAYIDDIAKVNLSFVVVIACHYLVVFPLLILYYYRVLKHIKRLRKDHEGSSISPLYGATEALIVKGHSQAKHRVFLFLSVFVVTGLCNLLLALALTINLSIVLATNKDTKEVFKPTRLVIKIVIIIQSVTVPLQGFLNAIVYGWTREDFLYIMATTHGHTPLKDPQINNMNDPPDDRVLSDMESSCNYESEVEQNSFRRNRQKTPDTNLSGQW